jgi:hypothetical protein
LTGRGLLLVFLLLIKVLDFIFALHLDLLRLVFAITSLLLLAFLDIQPDRRLDELGILLDQLLPFLRLRELAHVLLQVKCDACPAN